MEFVDIRTHRTKADLRSPHHRVTESIIEVRTGKVLMKHHYCLDSDESCELANIIRQDWLDENGYHIRLLDGYDVRPY